MEVTFFKVFFSKHKECEWLNERGQEGMLLKKFNDSKYTFEKIDGQKFFYSTEYLDVSPQSEDAALYFKSRNDLGITPVLYDKNWVYFVCNGNEIELNDDVFNKNARFHFWKMLLPFFYAVCGSVLCGYHAFAIGYLERIGQSGDGKIALLSLSRSKSAMDAILNIAKRCANYLLSALNGYFKLWTNILGENDAVAVLAIVVPITVILFVLAAFHLDEYIFYRQKAKKRIIKKIKEQASDAEQEV